MCKTLCPFTSYPGRVGCRACKKGDTDCTCPPRQIWNTATGQCGGCNIAGGLAFIPRCGMAISAVGLSMLLWNRSRRYVRFAHPELLCRADTACMRCRLWPLQLPRQQGQRNQSETCCQLNLPPEMHATCAVAISLAASALLTTCCPAPALGVRCCSLWHQHHQEQQGGVCVRDGLHCQRDRRV